MKQKINKKIVISAIIILFIIFIIFGTKFFLYLNFLLGNDLLIKLTSDKEYLSVERNQTFDLNFKTSVIANPFCKVDCNSTFEDLSENQLLDNNSFILKTNNPFEKQYKLEITKFGEGQKLLRFNLECSNKKTSLCHTDEKKTEKNILVNVKYSLSEEEDILKETIHKELKLMKKSISEQQIKILTLNELNQTKKKLLNLDLKKISLLTYKVSQNIELLNELKIFWDNKDYYQLGEKFEKLFIDKNDSEINETYGLLKTRVSEYNEFLNELNITSIEIDKLKNKFIIKENQVEQILMLVDNFNNQMSLFNGKNFEEKAFVVQSLKNNTTKISNNIIHEDRNETIIKLIEIDMQYLLLCNLTDKCYDRPSIQSRAYQETFNLRDACQEIIYLDEIYNNLNKTINTTINKTLFNETNNKKMFESLMSKTAILLLEKLPENASNSKIIKEFLERKNTINESSDLKNDDWIILELIKNKPKKCNEKTINTSLEKIQLKKIELKEEPEIIELTFEEPKTECCIFGVCKECCITDECTSNLTHIIFLHGHAFNKAVEADYSLESFNKLQNALEKQGYINAGALSLYDINMIPENSWGVMGQPISIKASYYLDVYQSTENYYWVQTKSDNIDTYAVKLNDIINTIIDKTGSEKSVIIAHSMGGLVARRYLQIFGSDKVKTLIMLGTPNHGISGKIADYCSITGEKLECRDMKEESLFMNKLNRNSLPLFNIYNVIGIGCDMQGQDGDGIVLKESASLEGAQNYLIKGECKGLDIFHRELTNIEKHPEIYKIILNALE